MLLVIFYLHNRDVWTCGKCFSKYGTWCGRSGAGLQCEPLDCIWQVSHVGLLSLVFDGLQSPDLEQETEDREAALLLFRFKKIWSQKSNWDGWKHESALWSRESWMWTHRDASLTAAMFVAEVPQVDGELAQLVVPQVAVSQQDGEQREGEGALAPCVLLQGTSREEHKWGKPYILLTASRGQTLKWSVKLNATKT